MRVFFALPISSAVKQQLSAQRAQLARQLSSQSLQWVAAQNYHITLAFLGEMNRSTMAELISVAETVVNQHQRLRLSIAELVWLPSFDNTDFLAASLLESAPLNALQRHLVNQLALSGVVLPNRSFHPHITLARAARGVHTSDFTQSPQTIYTEINELVLFESQQRSRCSNYQPLHAWLIGDSLQSAH